MSHKVLSLVCVLPTVLGAIAPSTSLLIRGYDVSLIQSDRDFLFSIGIKDNNLTASQSLPKQKSKEQKEPKENTISKKDINFVHEFMDSFVMVKHTNYVGHITGLNTRTDGYYPGHTHPVTVKLLNDHYQGTVCYYRTSQLEIITKVRADIILGHQTHGNTAFFNNFDH